MRHRKSVARACTRSGNPAPLRMFNVLKFTDALLGQRSAMFGAEALCNPSTDNERS